MDRKYWIGIISTVVIVPTLIFGWKNVQSIWASPEEIQKVDKKVDSQINTTEQISKLVIEQKARMDAQEMVNKLQVESLKEQLSLVAELKKKK